MNVSADILDWGSISGLGTTHEEVSIAFAAGKSIIEQTSIGERLTPAASLSSVAESALTTFLNAFPELWRHDRTVQMAAFCADSIIRSSGSVIRPDKTLVTIGSSRGATQFLEQRHASFLMDGKTSLVTSPTTTLGNISAVVASRIQADGPVVSQSMTCSTFVQSIGNALAWLGAGMCDEAWAGASEACLTPFTVAQFHALRILSNRKVVPYCSPGPAGSAHGMTLGEGAIIVRLTGKGNPKAKFMISGIGFAGETAPSLTGTTLEGVALRNAMNRCLEVSGKQPDIIIAHMPGTRQGDLSEWNAIRDLFPEHYPGILPLKWLTGHWLGASAGSSFLAAMHLLNGGIIPDAPYPTGMSGWQLKNPKNIMINALGFGGQAASLMISCKD